MDDIRELCERVIIIDHGNMAYDGDLDSLIKKHAPHKILNVTFDDAVQEDAVKKFGTIKNYNPYSVSFEVDREKVKDVAKDILSSDMPVDDILIDEVDIDDVIRKIFKR